MYLFPNHSAVASLQNTAITHDISLFALSSLLFIHSMPVKEPIMRSSHSTKSNHQATHVIKPGVSCCGAFRREKRESISGSDHILQLRGKLRFSKSRWQEYSAAFPVCPRQLTGAGKKELLPLYTVGRSPLMQTVPRRLQTLLTSCAPHCYPGILQTRKQDQKR